MNHFLVIDIGGTQMRGACYSPDSLTPLKIEKISTRHPSATPLERLIELVAIIWPEDQPVAGIAVAAPGPLDPYAGVVFDCPNIPGWENLPLRDIIEDRFQAPVALGNDANLATLGEWKYGAGQGHHHMIYVTVSTGIGGGVIIDDRLLLGAHGLAAEIGHLTVDPEGPLCGCGQNGHLEAVASGPAIARWAEQEISQGVPSSLPANQDLTARHISEAAHQGDALAIEALARAGTFLGRAMADYLHIFNPTAIVIGGGVSQSGALLLDPLRQALREYVITPQYLEDLTVTTAALGDNVGLIGGLALAQTLSVK
jgi:glucokinase